MINAMPSLGWTLRNKIKDGGRQRPSTGEANNVHSLEVSVFRTHIRCYLNIPEHDLILNSSIVISGLRGYSPLWESSLLKSVFVGLCGVVEKRKNFCYATIIIVK